MVDGPTGVFVGTPVGPTDPIGPPGLVPLYGKPGAEPDGDEPPPVPVGPTG